VQVIHVDGANKDAEIESLLLKSEDESDHVLSDREIQDIEAEFEKLFDLTEDEDKGVPPEQKDEEFENILTQAEEEINKPMLTVDSFKKERSPRLGRDKSPRKDGGSPQWFGGAQKDGGSQKDGVPQKEKVSDSVDADRFKKELSPMLGRDKSPRKDGGSPRRFGGAQKDGRSQKDGVPQKEKVSDSVDADRFKNERSPMLGRDKSPRKDGESPRRFGGAQKDGRSQKDGVPQKALDSVDGQTRASVDAKIVPTYEKLPEAGIKSSFQTEIKPQSLDLNV
jgi:hypothetical protein